MNIGKPKMLVLGAGGYLGERTVREAVAAECDVRGLARSESASARLSSTGARLLQGDAGRPGDWTSALAMTDVVVDLVQPPFPERISVSVLRSVARQREAITSFLVRTISALPVANRPLYLYVGGIDELTARDGVVADDSPRTERELGGARIGIPSHRLLRASGLAFASLYLGTVYGNGKAFASTILPGLANGSFPVIGSGSNQLPLFHVEDAARAIVHVARLGRVATGRSFVMAHSGGETATSFFEKTAKALGSRPPRHLPAWLVKLVAGAGAVELMAGDARVSPQALEACGFLFRYPTTSEGIEQMVRGYRQTAAAAAAALDKTA